jgi:hypothetical protein
MHIEMARKLKKPGFVTVTEFARRIGVSQPAVSQGIQNGRLVVYDGRGNRVSQDFRGRKWLKPAEANRDWDRGRLRLDDHYLRRAEGPDDLVTVDELSRASGVPIATINQMVKSGRIQAYDIEGRPWREPPRSELNAGTGSELKPGTGSNLRRQKQATRGRKGGRAGQTPHRASMPVLAVLGALRSED